MLSLFIRRAERAPCRDDLGVNELNAGNSKEQKLFKDDDDDDALKMRCSLMSCVKDLFAPWKILIKQQGSTRWSQACPIPLSSRKYPVRENDWSKNADTTPSFYTGKKRDWTATFAHCISQYHHWCVGCLFSCVLFLSSCNQETCSRLFNIIRWNS